MPPSGPRSSGDDLAARRVLTELLIQMTAATTRLGQPVYVMAATNRPQDCDPALLRRFDRKIEVPPPDGAARAAFLRSAAGRPEIAACLRWAQPHLAASASRQRHSVWLLTVVFAPPAAAMLS
jgi:SpoVK/Ycf46/Vps4 family AAA+-type ATPase